LAIVFVFFFPSLCRFVWRYGGALVMDFARLDSLFFNIFKFATSEFLPSNARSNGGSLSLTFAYFWRACYLLIFSESLS